MRKLIVNLKIFILLILLMGCSEEFLDVKPKGVLNEDHLTNLKGIEDMLIGAYSLLDKYGAPGNGNGISQSNWVFGGVMSDEAYKGSTLGDLPEILTLETFDAHSSISLLNNEWRILYAGIQRANDVLRILEKTEDIDEDIKNRITGEARFLRGHYHFELKIKWNNIPFVDEKINYEEGDFEVSNTEENWQKIESDFEFASSYLPEKQNSVGRANRWAAKAYLGKTYLFQKKWTEANEVLTDVINNGINNEGIKYGLIDKYSDLFNAEFNGNRETVFAVKFSVNDGTSSANNGNRGDRLNGPYTWGPPGSGFYQPTQSLVNSYRVDENGLPYLDDFNSKDVANDQGLKSNDPFTIEDEPLDPRIDWTIGRRGIPFLDWGIFPGQDAIREQSTGGPYSALKTIHRKAQDGTVSDKVALYGIYTNIDYNIIRFADVLLMAAETEVELNNLIKALEYVNAVRRRASNPEGFVKKYLDNNNPTGGYSDEPAANYEIGLYPSFPNQEFARKAVRFERKIELAMEGKRFFDLVRYGTAKETLEEFWAKEKSIHTYYNSSEFIEGVNEYLPIPLSQIDLSHGNLIQNKGY